MARTKRSFERILISDISVKGQSIAAESVGDRRIYVDSSKLIPGDMADLQELRRKKGMFEARPVQIIEPSTDRVEPWCPHFEFCGGCSWQHVHYRAQLRYKDIILAKALADHPEIGPPEEPVLESPQTTRYRNKLEYSFSTRRWMEQPLSPGDRAPSAESEAETGDTPKTQDDRRALGFFVPRQNNRVVDIRQCFHQDEVSDRIRNRVREIAVENDLSFHDPIVHVGLLRTLVVRISGTGQVMVALVVYEDDEAAIETVLGSLKNEFSEITSLYSIVNPKMNDAYGDCPARLYAGQEAIYEQIDDLKFRIGPLSFFQVNPLQTRRLYDLVREYAQLSGDELVYDLYTGTGSIALYLARQAKNIIGIEYVEPAVADARVNAELNGISNCSFYAGDMKDVLSDEFFAVQGRPDVLVCDPPRAGMHPDVLATILRSGAKNIVYVSCNPISLGRDLKELKKAYRVLRYRGVDMSPQTPHVETVMLLERR